MLPALKRQKLDGAASSILAPFDASSSVTESSFIFHVRGRYAFGDSNSNVRQHTELKEHFDNWPSELLFHYTIGDFGADDNARLSLETRRRIGNWFRHGSFTLAPKKYTKAPPDYDW